MKTLRTTLAMVMITVGSLVANAQGPMSFYTMRDNARFLTDRMVHVLNLSSALIDEIYCINYDYICGVNDYLDEVARGYRYDDYVLVLRARDAALRLLLSDAEWRLLMSYDYFYRPISFVDHRWSFGVYAHDRWGGRLFYREPAHFGDYRGGAHFGGMAPGRGVVANNMNRGGEVNRGGNMNGSGNMNRGGENANRGNMNGNRGNVTNNRDNEGSRFGNNSRTSATTSRTSGANAGISRTSGNSSISRTSSSRSNVGGVRTSGGTRVAGGTRTSGGVSGGGRR